MTVQQLAVTERKEQIGDLKIFWREAEPQTAAPVLYVHGNPTHSRDWDQFIVRTGGVAIDLPGFGRSDKPNSFDYSIPGYGKLLEQFIDHLGWDRFSIVVHDWGGVGLETAQRLHARVERLVIIDAVPLLPGYRWHRLARLWRIPVVGELTMGSTTKAVARLLTREANYKPGPLPKEMIDWIWECFDQGTQRSVLKLYRSAPSDVLAEAGADLGKIDAPALVVWGEHDPYIPHKFADDYAARLPNSELLKLPDAGHWPWLDRPDLVDRVTDFLLDRNNQS